ncbi:valine--tRNA ligase, partial [Patescibacteria group bacterium]|nr:valine--tRNA ligase [Patescibacteria group bacterium]
PKTYEPKEVEGKIYKLWEESGFFNPDKLPKTHKKPFTIVIPPPNVTGELHMGHALNSVIQDTIIRFKRMQGFKTLWLPGTDHAGIATQNVVEKKLRKEGKSRFDLGREKFIEEIWAWKNKYGDIILNQLKKLGCSLDWSRTRFTMDQGYSEAVKEAFLHYYKKGWLYKGKRVVSWCPRCQTSLSDLELEYEEEKGKLWYIKYLLADDKNKFITVATTRPETMLGDTAVAVNPKDKRFKGLIGKKLILPLVNKEIPVVTDDLIDVNFGTGALKVTPAHDFVDYEIGQRHKLEIVQVIDEKGKMINVPEKYSGLRILETREKVVADLQEQGYLEKIEEYQHQIPKCYRCHTTVESIPSLQWFLNMKELAKIAGKPVKDGKIKFHPASFKKPYLDWLSNIKDWCVSRQIWWGHKIPLEGENDVLDTWFSSALWPFATLGWPEKTKDLKTFYPTSVLTTARDILNLWVTRMIFSGMEFMRKIPFEDVIIHATVLTRDGKRMSKSLGTGINPMDLIEKYGADATRFGLSFQIMGGQDIKFVEDNILMGKKFCNKIWNASRFVLQKTGNTPLLINKPKDKDLTSADKKILKTLEKIVESTTKDIKAFNFGKAAHKLYDFFWHDFCDVYIEKFKTQSSGAKSQKVILYTLLTSLKLLHPFIPFITEEIYQQLPVKNRKKSLMVEKWPSYVKTSEGKPKS